jgi:hypothetical protein
VGHTPTAAQPVQASFPRKTRHYCAIPHIERSGSRLAKIDGGMSGYPSVNQKFSEFRVEKARTDGTLLLSSGASIPGSFFVAGSSATHAGPERIKDVLNAEPGFFPFEVRGSNGEKQTILYNRDHVIYVELVDDEAHLDPGYDVATRRTASMLCSNGARLKGVVSVYRPQGRDRLSDFARSSEQFHYLETPDVTYLVNVRHLIELVEESS